jgi:bacterioferritin-associated ferredoxin
MQLRAIRSTVIDLVRKVVEASMYVCLCNALTESDMRPHTVGGDLSVSMVYRACGCQPQCGKCAPIVRQMLREGAEGPTAVLTEGAD